MRNEKQKIYFAGMGGSGVSAIALFMAEHGHTIIGSDRTFDQNPSSPIAKVLRAKGITVVPEGAEGIDSSTDIMVMSTAVECDKPEIKKAMKLKLPIMSRPDYLAQITREFQTIGVAGTSGKSTTSGMLAFLMQKLALSPNFIGGGRVRQFHMPDNLGNSITGDSSTLIIEACESDGSIVYYKPHTSVILNLTLDHQSIEETAGLFRTLILNTSERIIINADDEELMKLAPASAITFSISNSEAKYTAENVVLFPLYSEFKVNGTGFRLNMPGAYNLENAIASIATLAEMGIALQRIAEVLPNFTGIERRMEIHLNTLADGGHIVIDDYAHNPHKIASMMATIQKIAPSACYIFQPHGYAPTRLMLKGYIDTFNRWLRPEDKLYLLPIFYSGGTVAKDISSEHIASGVHGEVEVLSSRAEVMNILPSWDIFVIFGARDDSLSETAKHIASKLAN